MGRIIGIDLGTTNSVIAALDGPNLKVLETQEGGKLSRRSAVSLRRRKGGKNSSTNEDILIGKIAIDNWVYCPKDTIISVKRLMGRGVNDPEVQKVRQSMIYDVVAPSDGTEDSIRVVMGGKQYSPVDISAMILQKLKEDAEKKLNEEVTHAVITVPAYFSQAQRHATRRAALQAGLRVIRILDEPTAAAIAFGMESESESEETKTILVFDLGGGTFDISVLAWAGKVFVPLTLEGDMWLGGDNFDQVLVNRVVAEVRDQHGVNPTSDHRFMASLKIAAQEAKENLSSTPTAVIQVGGLQDGDGNLIDVEVEVTREEFERSSSPLVRRAMELTRKAVEGSKLTTDAIDYVLLAGNSSYIPAVQRSVEEMFGAEKVVRKVHPKHSVALGAALIASRLGPRVVCQSSDPDDPKRECGEVNATDATVCAKCGSPLLHQDSPADEGGIEIPSDPEGVPLGIAPFYYGIQSAGDAFNVFVRKNDPYPTQERESKTFTTRTSNQRMICIPVYGGEDLAKASQNEKQGEAFAIIPRDKPAGTEVRISLWLNKDGIFEISAELSDSTDLKPWIIKGEFDAKVVQSLAEADRTAMAKAAAISTKELKEIDDAKDKALSHLRKGDMRAAQSETERLEQLIAQVGTDGAGGARERAEGIIGYVEFVLREFGWAFGKGPSSALNALVQEGRQHLEANRSRKLDEIARTLERMADGFPDMVKLLVAIRGAIIGRVQASEPKKAQDLLSELYQIEAMLRSNDPAAHQRLNTLAERIEIEIKAIESRKPGGARCSEGHETGGARHCPECGEDMWIVGNGGQAASARGSSGR